MANNPSLSATNVIRLNHTHSFLNLQQNFFKQNFSFLLFELWQISSKLNKFHTVRPHSPRITRNWHHLLTYYTLCFRHLPRQRTLKNSSELHKFRAVCPHSPQITRNSHHLLTCYTLCFKCLTSDRELLKIPANQAKFAQFTHIPHELCKLRAFCTKFIHI